MELRRLIISEVRKAKVLTINPIGLNIMLLSEFVDDIANKVCEEDVKVVASGVKAQGKYMKMWQARLP